MVFISASSMLLIFVLGYGKLSSEKINTQYFMGFFYSSRGDKTIPLPGKQLELIQ